MKNLLLILCLILVNQSYGNQMSGVLDKMRDPEIFEIKLKGLPWSWVTDVQGKMCGLGEYPRKEEGNYINKIEYNNGRLIKKVSNGVVSWVLKGVKGKITQASCENGLEIMVSKGGKFIFQKVEVMEKTLQDYAMYACHIDMTKERSIIGTLFAKERNLTKEEAQAVAKCFMGAGSGDRKPSRRRNYCGKYLFEKSEPARILDCDKRFMEMGDRAGDPRTQVGKVDAGYCLATLGGLGENSSTVICPVGAKTGVSINSGDSQAYYAKGNCYSKRSNGCHKIAKRALDQRQEGSLQSPEEPSGAVQ